MPFCCRALLHTAHKRNLVLLLAVGIPRFIGALLEAVGHRHLALEVPVLVPLARSTVAVAFFGALRSIVVKDLPRTHLFSVLVILTLLIDTAVLMPPRPIARADAVVGHHTLNGGFLLLSVIEFLVAYLCIELQERAAQKKNNRLFEHNYKLLFTVNKLNTDRIVSCQSGVATIDDCAQCR